MFLDVKFWIQECRYINGLKLGEMLRVTCREARAEGRMRRRGSSKECKEKVIALFFCVSSLLHFPPFHK